MAPAPTAEIAWVAAAVACYGLAASLAYLRLPVQGVSPRWMLTPLTLGVVLLGAVIAWRWRVIGQGPFMTLYEVLLSNLFTVGLILVLAYSWAPRLRAGAVVSLPLLALLGIWSIALSPQPVPLPPTFDNPWLWVHVLTGKIFFGILLIAVGLCGVLIAGSFTKRFVGVEEEHNLDRAVWQLTAIAFVFDSFMLVAGSVWAHDAWGRYWAWDPLETWAFLTWLVLGTVLHSRLTFRLPPWAGWVMLVGVFLLAFLTFFGVPFLSMAPHKGIM